VQAGIFSGPCHGVSSVGHIRPVVDSDTMIEMSLGPNLTQKLAQELRFPLTLINSPSS
jgi:hypothetical protein